MADNSVGSVTYSVNVDFSGLAGLQTAVDKTTRSVEQDFTQTDKVIKQTSEGVSINLTKTASAVRAAGSNMSGSFAQAGIQFQQFVGQVQGGTSALTALSQQGADLGIVLGAPLIGVIVSLAAAIGGVLYNSIEKTKGSMSALPDELKKYLDAVEQQYAQLDEVSRAEFAQAEIGKVATAYQNSAEEVTRLTNRLEKLKTTGLLGEDLDVTTSLPEQIKKTAEQLEVAKKRAESFTQILNELSKVTTTGLATEKFAEDINNGATAAERLQDQLKVAITRMTEGDLAARRMAAAQAIGLKAGEMLDKTTDDLIVKYYQLEQIEKSRTEEKRQQVEFQRESRAELDRELQAELQILNAKERAKADYDRTISGISKDLESPAQRARRELEERLNVIKEFNNLESMEQARKTEAGIAAEQAYQLRLTEITKAEEGQRLQTQQNLLNQSLSLTENVFGNIADAIERSKGRESAAFKAAFLAQKAAAIAMAVLQIELAAATAIAPPPFGLGPVAGLPYSQFIRGIGYTSVAIMAGQTLAGMGGGKLYGGPVSGGMMYPFMENGKPEALQMGGKTYLWTGGGNGTVIPNGDLTGGGQGVNISVVVENYGSDNVDVQRQTKGSGVTAQEVIKIVVGNISQRGEIHSAITRNTTAGNRSS